MAHPFLSVKTAYLQTPSLAQSLTPNTTQYCFLSPSEDKSEAYSLPKPTPIQKPKPQSKIKFRPDQLPALNLALTSSIGDEDVLYADHGYKKLSKLSACIQGGIYKAIKLSSPSSGPFHHVAIKHIRKALSSKQIAIRDGMTYMVEEDIVKEAMILKHLTVDAQPVGGSIVRFVDFFESSTAWHLVTEYVDGLTLKQFVRRAHAYIGAGQLSRSFYAKHIKLILWQLATLLDSLHSVYHCCHLDLVADNVMLKGLHFEALDDGVGIVGSVEIKLLDFGVSEVWRGGASGDFDCNKRGLSIGDGMVAPNVDDAHYDARAGTGAMISNLLEWSGF